MTVSIVSLVGDDGLDGYFIPSAFALRFALAF
jgi:hypothetical protein